jgi:hypothetical protein
VPVATRSALVAACVVVVGSGASHADPPRCSDPCLFLQDTALAKLPDAFKAACPDAKAQDLEDCTAVDYARNCIYAAHGVAFKKKQWRELFAAKPWYKSRGIDANKLALSDVERANVKALAALGKTCKKDVSIDKADFARVKAWVAALPKAPAPKLVFEAGRAVTGGELERDLVDELAQARATISFDHATARYVKPTTPLVPPALAKAIGGMTPAPRLVELDLALVWEDDNWDSGVYVWLAYDATGQLVALASQDWP